MASIMPAVVPESKLTSRPTAASCPKARAGSSSTRATRSGSTGISAPTRASRARRGSRQLGFNIGVLAPGQPSCMYHGEDEQEDFLVLAGECLLLIEGEERLLRQWDFVHCPPWTEHVFVGAGDGPCALLAVGTRSGEWRDLSAVRGRAPSPGRRRAGDARAARGVRATSSPTPRSATATAGSKAR